MKQIVLISHGTMAEGMYKAAEMVFGSLPGVYYLCLSEDKDIQVFRKELQDILYHLNQDEPAAVLCDIGGGSPYNTVLELLDGMGYLDNSYVISGMNLPLLILLLMAADMDGATVKACMADSSGSIRLFEACGEEGQEEAL